MKFNWEPERLLGPRSRYALVKLREHFASFEPDVCVEAAKQIRQENQNLSVEEQCAEAVRRFARQAARDGAVTTLLPGPLSLVVDYRRTSRHIANMTATMLVIRNPGVDLEALSSAEVRDRVLGESPSADPSDDASRDLSLLGGLAFAKAAGRASRHAARRALRMGPFRRWWFRPLTGPMTAAVWNYAEVSAAGRLLRAE